MKQVLAPLLAFGLIAGPIAATIAPAPAEAQRRSDQGEARKEMRAGNVLPLREIEKRVLPSMGGAEYLGPAYDSTAMAYRLKSIRYKVCMIMCFCSTFVPSVGGVSASESYSSLDGRQVILVFNCRVLLLTPLILHKPLHTEP